MEPASDRPREPAGLSRWLQGRVPERRIVTVVPHAPGDVASRLKGATQPHADKFTMVSKLSGGGIVVRVLRAPETDRPFFGQVATNRFTIAPVHRTGNVTPFQPILRGEVEAADGGSRVTLTMSPHPNAQNWDVVFTIAGVLMLVGAVIQALADTTIALMLGGFGLAALALPRARARLSFGVEVGRTLPVLAELLDAPALASTDR